MDVVHLILSAALFSIALADPNVGYRPGQCLRGDMHRELPCPEPEGPDYQACYQWSDQTCCTATFTEQLAGATVRNIDGFHWSRCEPPLSQRCEEYFTRVECFYRCSPNVAHWALDEFPSALAGLPVCGNFCDEWFDACTSDMTCAVNWITDWLYVNGVNECRDDAVCRNFSDVYGDGRGLCSTLWGQSFVYTDESPDAPDRTCLSLWWPQNETNPNSVAIRNTFGSLVDTVLPPSCNPEGSNIEYRPGQCLRGDMHRELPCPEPEGPDYQACYQWSDQTCCTATFTEQLAGATVRNIDGFHWSRCEPPLSQRCEEYFRRVECFYRCSPNVAHWALDEFPSALAGLPVCGNFCDEWFDACTSDMTCAVNWITDWLYVNGVNECRDDAVCRSFSDVYGDGRGLCNTLWGQSFVYTDESPDAPDRTCLSLWWPQNETNPNSVAIRNTFGSLVDTVTAAPCGVGSSGQKVGASAFAITLLVIIGELLLG